MFLDFMVLINFSKIAKFLLIFDAINILFLFDLS